MSALTKGYNPAAVTVVFRGALLDGFGPDSKVECTFPDAFSMEIGTDGEACMTRINDYSATVKITLMQSSYSNDVLSALHSIDRNSPLGGGVGVLQIVDLTGTTLINAPQARIQKFADIAFGKTSGTREWTFIMGQALVQVGGNVPAF